MFKALTFFRFSPKLDLSKIDDLLPAAKLKPVGPLELCSAGFVSPFGQGEEEVLSHRIGNWLWLAVGRLDRVLPAAVVNDKLEAKLQELERAEGRRPGGRERKRIKDDLVHELIPQAFVKRSRTDVILDLAAGYAVVDTTSKKQAEAVISEIRGMLGSFPAVPLSADAPPRAVLTSWLSGEPLPEELSLGGSAELQDPVEGGGKVKIQDLELLSEEVANHLGAGMQVTRLALSMDDHIAFVLGEDLTVRSLKLLEGALEQLGSGDADDMRAELDARFALLSGEVSELFGALGRVFRFNEQE